VTKGVIDLLEAVQVEDEERSRLSFTVSCEQRLFKPVHEKGAIWKSGETVMQRPILECLGESLPLADIAQ
jgi:hypothetical protein